jgi:nicotinate-nucleotide adenylyltransferase
MTGTGRVGVFGGTFNPVHWAHLRAAEEVVEAVGLDRMLFVPSAEPPHKAAGGGDPVAPAALRLAWLRRATADNPRFEVDPLEIERGGRSYSVDTLRAVGERLAPERPVFVIGLDAFVEMDGWREPEALFTLAHFAVMTRPPFSDVTLRGSLPCCVRDAVRLAPDGRSAHHARGTWIRLVPVTPLDVSASDVRRRLREGRSVRYLLPEAVYDAVVSSGAYDPPEGVSRARREARER